MPALLVLSPSGIRYLVNPPSADKPIRERGSYGLWFEITVMHGELPRRILSNDVCPLDGPDANSPVGTSSSTSARAPKGGHAPQSAESVAVLPPLERATLIQFLAKNKRANQAALLKALDTYRETEALAAAQAKVEAKRAIETADLFESPTEAIGGFAGSFGSRRAS